MIEPERIKALNFNDIQQGRFVLYWMQAAQRAEYNPALEFAVLEANKRDLPVLVFFGITGMFPEANQRHYYFMLQGLKETMKSLEEREIQFLVQNVSPELGAAEVSKSASLVVTDQGYTKIEKSWSDYVAKNVKCPCLQVESNVTVPVEFASQKEEYSAAIFRPKIKRVVTKFLEPVKENVPKYSLNNLDYSFFDIQDPDKAVKKLNVDDSVTKVGKFCGGTLEAKSRLDFFIRNGLDDYPVLKNDPTKDCQSNLSPYLHFGQISPVFVALKVLESDSLGMDVFLEELIVRRELAVNFVFYNPYYDSFLCLPDWAKKTLNEHKSDQREPVYSVSELENCETYDDYWNSAQKQMVTTGKMHGYMRMYWGKKIIEWSKTPQEAYRAALYLNNKYELDGRDPNGYAGVAWCFGKHDRPWKERDIFGKIRYMNAKGLRRKFKIDSYVEQVNSLSS